MILGVEKLLKLVKEKNLVEGLCERELENPEGAGFDLRLGQIYEVFGKGFLGEKERETPKTKLLVSYNPDETESFLLRPRVYYVIKTIEKVNTPSDIAILFRPRSTLYRSGIMIFTGNVSPGYRGELTFGMINFSQEDFKIELGARIVHAMFYEVKGKTNLYRGQWQGGRVSTKKREKQV